MPATTSVNCNAYRSSGEFMKVAIIGTGIAGNVAAYKLRQSHDITVFEADSYIGGHTNTVDVYENGQQFAVDTGFIVFNDRTYPNFITLLDELGVASQASDMSFSVQNERTGLEYNGTNLNALFAQRRNLLRPSFYRMLRDILRFNKEAPELLQPEAPDLTLGQFTALELKEEEESSRAPMGWGSYIIDEWLAGESITLHRNDRYWRADEGLPVFDTVIYRFVGGNGNANIASLLSGECDILDQTSGLGDQSELSVILDE